MDAVNRELSPISSPGDVGGRAVCGSTGENECWSWVIH